MSALLSKGDLTPAQQKVLRWVEEADFDGTGCAWSQERIGRALGLSREHVCRCVKALEALGFVSVRKLRWPGSPWPHNVTKVRDWNPNLRTPVLIVADRLRLQDHIERTATYLALREQLVELRRWLDPYFRARARQRKTMEMAHGF